MLPALVLLFVAFVLAVYVDAACNPDGDGKPDCVGRTGLKSRDFWDPTHFWLCDGTGEAVLKPCNQTGFDPKTGDCVAWQEWVWYDPCAEA
ncbi:hypothetical protein KR009_010380 [Drosophila setifemur]|nr:hypothetical protein KR009_010380 [Drosophila setifemur]